MDHKRAFGPALLGSIAGWFALVFTAGAVMAGARFDFEPPVEQLAELVLGVADGQTGGALSARIRIARVGSLDPRRVLIAGEGRRSLRLAPGEYRVWASHGPEYSVAQTRITLHAAERTALELTLTRQVQSTRYVSCDLHVHSDGSHDSKVSIAQRIASAQAEGLQVAVITDHNRVTSADRLPASEGPARTTLLRGVEITSWDPEFGHFNMFPADAAPQYKHSSPEQLLAALPPRNTRFLQVNHPRLMHHIGFFELVGKAHETTISPSVMRGFDGIEVWNGYDLHRAAARDRVMEDWFELLRHGKHVVATGGSDSHDLTRTVIGYPRTQVALPAGAAQDATQLAAALRAGHAYVTDGPVLELEVNGHKPGDTLTIARGTERVRVQVRVDGPAWMDLRKLELWADGRRLLTRRMVAFTAANKSPQQPRALIDLEVTIGKAHSLLAVVRGERAMDALFDRQDVLPFAFTNPVWIARR